MANRIIANIKARNSNLDATNESLLLPYIEDICDGVIQEIVNEMQIQTEVTINNVQTGSQTIIATGQETSIT